MIGRFWSLCADLWGAIGHAASAIAEGAGAAADFAAARMRGCLERMNRAGRHRTPSL